MSSWAIVLGVIAFALGIYGATVIDEVGDDLDCIAEADTAKQLEACED